MRSVVIADTVIYYNYQDNYEGLVDENDIEHIGELLAEGYIEGELATTDPTDLEADHYGWWTIKAPPPHIEEEEVTLIASGYEWICPNCNTLNTHSKTAPKVTCNLCNRTYMTDEALHAHG